MIFSASANTAIDVVGIVTKVDAGVVIVVAVGGVEVIVGVNIVIVIDTGVDFNVLGCSLSSELEKPSFWRPRQMDTRMDRQTGKPSDRDALLRQKAMTKK